jgi:hypothetical protein
MNTPAEIAKLVGTWEVTESYPAGTNYRSSIRIDERGAYVAHAILEGKSDTITADMEGIFQVIDGMLVDTPTKASNTEARLPRTMCSRILRLDSREMVIHWEPNEEIAVPAKDVVFRRVEK